jgi:cytochrome c-type biogenesis protein CcmH
MKFLIKLILPIIFIFNSQLIFALSPEERLENAKLETRANELFLEVRCLSCNGQVIENSDSEFARQMRALIRKKILEGKNNDEIKQELLVEFGNDILTNSTNKRLYLFLGILVFVISIILLKKIKDWR